MGFTANKISRRDFLKLLGFGATIAAVGGFGGVSQLITNPRLSNKPASAQQSPGSWTSAPNCTVTPIHAALLPNGKILYVAGSSYDSSHQYGPYDARLLDLTTGQEKVFNERNSPMTDDLFCMGQTTLANGNLLFAGGTAFEGFSGNPNNCNGLWHGSKAAYEFDVPSEQFVKVASMRHGRWYPTLVTLPDGRVWCSQGYDEYGGNNRILEVYQPSSRTWSLVQDPGSSQNYCVGAGSEGACPGAGSPCYTGVCPPSFSYYPRSHVMPNGRLVTCGFQREIHSWNPADGRFTFLANSSTFRFYGTSFLLPLQNIPSEKGRILIVNGTNDWSNAILATTTCEIIDFNASATSVPVLRTISPVFFRRTYPAPVILPDGRCLLLGGYGGGPNAGPYDSASTPEMFDPVSETWRSDLPPASTIRPYHQVALLLPDGRVWNAGGAPVDGVWSVSAQFFSPGYLFAGSRPTVSAAPTVGGYGSSITIPTPDAPAISSNPSGWRVSLVRLMNTTHHYDANQRLVWLQITNIGSSSITVSAPINANIAPPGDYMVFLLNPSGVPSVGRVVRIPGTAQAPDTTPPTQVQNLLATTASTTQINLSWTANPTADGVTQYNIYRGTTAGFAVTPGTTPPTATSATNSYSNTGLTASTTYYYRVVGVDAAGNIGPLSSEASATTTAAGTGTVFYNVPTGGSTAALAGGSNTRYGEEVNTSSSVLIGKSLRSWMVRLRRSGSPSGNVTARVRRFSDDAVVASFSQTINATALTTSFTNYIFTLTTPYTIQNRDRILVEYNGPAYIHIELTGADAFDGPRTRRIRYDGTSYGSGSQDITGTMSS
jgi:hypothetical protein